MLKAVRLNATHLSGRAGRDAELAGPAPALSPSKASSRTRSSRPPQDCDALLVVSARVPGGGDRTAGALPRHRPAGRGDRPDRRRGGHAVRHRRDQRAGLLPERAGRAHAGAAAGVGPAAAVHDGGDAPRRLDGAPSSRRPSPGRPDAGPGRLRRQRPGRGRPRGRRSACGCSPGPAARRNTGTRPSGWASSSSSWTGCSAESRLRLDPPAA